MFGSFELMLASPGRLLISTGLPLDCTINTAYPLPSIGSSSFAPFALLPLLTPLLMVTKRGGGVPGRRHGRRGRGSRAPRSSRGGRRGTASAPSSSLVEEGFWRYDFLLRVLSRSAAPIPLPSSFAAIVSKLKLSGLLLRLQGCVRSPTWVELEVESSRLIFLGSGWRYFSRHLNLRDGDNL